MLLAESADLFTMTPVPEPLASISLASSNRVKYESKYLGPAEMNDPGHDFVEKMTVLLA